MTEIEERHTYHAIRGESGQAKVNEVRDLFKAFAVKLEELLPPGREANTAQTQLQIASFFSVQAMARLHGDPVVPEPEPEPKPKASRTRKAKAS